MAVPCSCPTPSSMSSPWSQSSAHCSSSSRSPSLPYSSPRVMSVFAETGANVFSRVLGVLLAVRFVLDGIK